MIHPGSESRSCSFLNCETTLKFFILFLHCKFLEISRKRYYRSVVEQYPDDLADQTRSLPFDFLAGPHRNRGHPKERVSSLPMQCHMQCESPYHTNLIFSILHLLFLILFRNSDPPSARVFGGGGGYFRVCYRSSDSAFAAFAAGLHIRRLRLLRPVFVFGG